jgi:hypothetical protein
MTGSSGSSVEYSDLNFSLYMTNHHSLKIQVFYNVILSNNTASHPRQRESSATLL